jgi:hypothetical protein
MGSCPASPRSPDELGALADRAVGRVRRNRPARRSDLGRAIRAAELRLELPLERDLAEALGAELRGLRARLN